MAISGASNDSGVFELRLHDERYLPFEGAGAISRWRLHFPQCDPKDVAKRFAQFDYDSISDVIMHLRYCARDGGEALAGKVRESLRQTLNQLQTLQDEQGLFRLFSVRHEFPDAWFRTRAAGQPIALEIKKVQLPYFVQGRMVTVQSAFSFDGADKVTELAEPELVQAQNLWNVQVTPPVSATDVLILIIYTIG